MPAIKSRISSRRPHHPADCLPSSPLMPLSLSFSPSTGFPLFPLPSVKLFFRFRSRSRATVVPALYYLDTVVRMREVVGREAAMEPRYGGREGCNHSKEHLSVDGGSRDGVDGEDENWILWDHIVSVTPLSPLVMNKILRQVNFPPNNEHDLWGESDTGSNFLLQRPLYVLVQF